MAIVVAGDRGIMLKDLSLATIGGTNSTAMQKFERSKGNVEIGYEDKEPEALEE